MNFLKQLAGMFSPKPGVSGGDPGLYYYVKCLRCGEVIRFRINPMNDLSLTDGGDYYVRKVIVGRRCYNRIEAQLTYSAGSNANRKLINSEVSGGELVDKQAFEEDERLHGAQQE